MKLQEKIDYEVVISLEQAQLFQRAMVYMVHRIREHGKEGGVCNLETALSLRDELKLLLGQLK